MHFDISKRVRTIWAVSRALLILSLCVGPARGQVLLEINSLPNQRAKISWKGTGSFEVQQSATVNGPWQASGVVPQTAGGTLFMELAAADALHFFRVRHLAGNLLTIESSSPAQNETGVAVTRETILRLTAPLAADTTLDSSNLYAVAAGRKILSRVELSSDRRKATLFYLERLPADTRVEVTFDGAGVFDSLNQPVDLNGDGVAGGMASLVFETLSTTSLPTTGIQGHVYASEKNPDGSNRPLRNVTITVDGMEETSRTTTDANGFFLLQPCPAGRFFVSVDGRTAEGSQWPTGAYYPFVGKAWEAAPGRTNNLAGGSGVVFLPFIQADALKPVSATNETKVTFASSVLATNAALAGVEISVPANALFADSGSRGGKVGIAPVPPDRLPEPLPPGLNLPIVITIQTDGPSNFDQPVAVKFPNLPDPVTGIKLGPGEKTVLWSFNHDTGRWEPQGTMTISADGNFAISDPGVGVRQPGWHGVSPGTGGGGGPPGPGPCTANCDDDNDDDDLKRCKNELASTINSAQDCLTGAFAPGAGGFNSKKSGCLFGAGSGVVSGARDCYLDPGSCTATVINGVGGSLIGCGEFAGELLGQSLKRIGPVAAAAALIQGCLLGAGLNACALYDCLTPGGDAACLPDAYEDSLDKWLKKVDLIGSIFGGVPESPLRRQAVGSLPPVVPEFLHEARSNAFFTQVRFSESLRRMMIATYGTDRWFSTNRAGAEVSATFLQSLSDALETASPGGTALTDAEKATLRALPRPAGTTDAEVNAVMTRMEGWSRGTLTLSPAEIAQFQNDGLRFAQMLAVYQQMGWIHPLSGARNGLIQLTQTAQRFCGFQGGTGAATGGGGTGGGTGGGSGGGAGGVVGAPAQQSSVRTMTYLLRNFDTGFDVRGKIKTGESFSNLIMTPNSFHGIFITDDQTGIAAVAFFQSANTGQQTIIPCAAWLDGATVLPDADGDGLPDISEMIVGSDPRSADSDGDGIPDGAELSAGTNPLDGQALSLGAVATRDTAGNAVDVDTVNDLAIIADSSKGLAVMNVANPLAPILLSQTNIANRTFDRVAAAGQFVAAVPGAASVATARVHSFRVLPDGTMALAGSVAVGTVPRSVAAAGRYAYVRGQNGNLESIAIVRLNDALLVRHVPVPGGASALELAIDGDTLWIAGASGLLSFRIVGDDLQPLGSLPLNGLGSISLTAGNGRVYMGDNGFQIVDGSQPATPVLLFAPTNRQAAVLNLALASPRIMLANTRLPREQLSLYDVTTDRSTNFLATFETPGTTHVIVPHRGYALATDGDAGLAVVNFLAPDRGTNPPSIVLRPFVSHPPSQQESDQPFYVSTVTTDDVQVRDVEFYVNGTLFGRSGKYPFATTLVAPAITSGRTNFTLRAKATDTGGNSAWSQELTFTLLPDVTPARLLAVIPANGSTVARGSVSSVGAVFDSLMALASFQGAWSLMSAGPDGNLGTADDVAIPGGTVVINGPEQTAALQFAAPLLSGKYRSRLLGSIADLGGNSIGTNITWDFTIPSARAVLSDPIDKYVFQPNATPRIAIRFDEKLNPASATPGSLRLVTTNQADPLTVPGSVSSVSPDGRSAVLDMNQPLTNGTYRVLFTRDLRDAYGSSVETNFPFTFTVKGPALWTNRASGIWTGATNWTNQLVPVLNDNVIVDVPNANPTISVRNNVILTSIRSEETVAIDAGNGFLQVIDRAIFNGPLNLENFGTGMEVKFMEVRGSAILNRSLRIGEDASFYGPVVMTEGDSALYNGRSHFYSTLDSTRTINIGSHSLILESGSVATLRNMQVQFGGPGSAVVIAPGGRLEIIKTNPLARGIFFLHQGASGARVLNAGELIKKGPIEAFSGISITNSGTIRVEEGSITLGRNSENTGIIEVKAGTQLKTDSFFRHVGGRIFGDGIFTAPDNVVINALYEVTGTTAVTRAQSTAAFNVPIRSTGAWLVTGSASFNGATTELLGPVTLNGGGLILNSPGGTVLADLQLTNSARLGGTGQVRFTSERTLTVPLALEDSLLVRIESPWTIATNLAATEESRLEIAANTVWTGGSISGHVDLLPGIELTLSNTVHRASVSLSFPTPGILRKISTNGTILQNANGIHITNSSLIEVQAGSITTLGSASFYIQEAGRTHLASGTFLVADALRLDGGELTGSGTVAITSDAVNRECRLAATVSPGAPYGKLSFTSEGAPIFLTNSVALFDIGGPTPGVSHDQIAIERGIRIRGGTLAIRTTPGFVPTLGQEFTLFTFTSRQGTFPIVTGLDLGGGRKYRVVYENTAIKLRVE